MKTNLTIKLCRFGRKHQPFFRLGVLPAFRNPARNFAIEYVGYYNPKTKDFSVNEERLNHHLSLNIKLTKTVESLLKKNNKLTIKK